MVVVFVHLLPSSVWKCEDLDRTCRAGMTGVMAVVIPASHLNVQLQYIAIIKKQSFSYYENSAEGHYKNPLKRNDKNRVVCTYNVCSEFL